MSTPTYLEQPAEKLAKRFWSLRVCADNLPMWSELEDDERAEKVANARVYIAENFEPFFADQYKALGRKEVLGNYDVDAWENPEAVDIALGRIRGHIEHDINCGIPHQGDPDQSSRCTCGAESAVGQLDEVLGEALIAADQNAHEEERERLEALPEEFERLATMTTSPMHCNIWNSAADKVRAALATDEKRPAPGLVAGDQPRKQQPGGPDHELKSTEAALASQEPREEERSNG